MAIDFKKQLERFRIDKDVVACRKCPGLNIPMETMSAPGAGRITADVFVVGQSLHSYNPETPVQIPFVGPIKSSDSGVLLYDILDKNGIELSKNLFITNVVHCHPDGNRTSLEKEIENCRDFLSRELELVKPKLIITIGADARRWFGLPSLMSGELVQFTRYKGKYYIVSAHPSFILRYCSKDDKEKFEDQFGRTLRKARKMGLYK